MALKKKGSIVLKKNNELKVTYVHRNAEPEAVGAKLVKWIRSAGHDAISAYFDQVIMVKEEDPMTKEQIESYKKYMPEPLWKDDLIWPEALAYTKNAVAPLKDGYPWMVDYAGFNGAWVDRWRYVIDLDDNMLIVVMGGMEMMHQETDMFSSDFVWIGKVAPTEVGRFPLDNIPENWIEECHQDWGSRMLVAVKCDKNAEAVESERIQAQSKGGYNPNDYDWEKIRFFYGQNKYDEMISDMEEN